MGDQSVPCPNCGTAFDRVVGTNEATGEIKLICKGCGTAYFRSFIDGGEDLMTDDAMRAGAEGGQFGTLRRLAVRATMNELRAPWKVVPGAGINWIEDLTGETVCETIGEEHLGVLLAVPYLLDIVRRVVALGRSDAASPSGVLYGYAAAVLEKIEKPHE